MEWCQGNSHPKPRPKPKRPNSHPRASCLPSEGCVEPTWVPTYLGSPVTIPLLWESHGISPLGWLHSVPTALRVSGVYSMLGSLAQLRVHLHSTLIAFSGTPPGESEPAIHSHPHRPSLAPGGNLHAAEVLAFCMPLNVSDTKLCRLKQCWVWMAAFVAMGILVPLGFESVMTSLNNAMWVWYRGFLKGKFVEWVCRFTQWRLWCMWWRLTNS